MVSNSGLSAYVAIAKVITRAEVDKEKLTKHPVGCDVSHKRKNEIKKLGLHY